LTSFDRNTLDGLRELREFSLWRNQLTSLHKTTFQNNLNLRALHLGINKFNALSNAMFSHLKFLDFLNLLYNNCINKNYENAISQLASIEKDLIDCTIGYLSLENDALQDTNNILYYMISKVMKDVTDIKNIVSP
jgi:hypothetical protein